MTNEILHSRIEERFNDIFETPPEVPSYIYDNLSHHLRPYQEQALRHFIYTQRSDAADVSFNHLLFHMATGSGKTLVLAATILYLYKEHNQQNFIFFVNSDAIIKKTYDNLTNKSSSKYLFARDGIEIDGERISVQVVDTFPFISAENTIYLKLTTIQKLHMDLTNPRENGLTYESLEDHKFVLLADEAHHINALTRSDKKKLTTREAQEKTWENTVNRLLHLYPENRLIEYTATINLKDDTLFNKYKDKIVYQYDLKRFMQHGYSKNVVLLRANEDDNQKMLHAMLLSQYRKYVAKENGIDLKPIVLFKSNKIAISKEANASFFEIVRSLTVDQLTRVVEHGKAVHQNRNSIWHKMFQYYSEQNLANIIQDLQWDFTEETTINANDASFLSENNTLLLNTLEEVNNPIRTIFAVAKLNEGWDVLNLFDIVRISEGASNTKMTTDSEAQLIGRGARYYPFEYEGENAYIRRFDTSPSDLKVIETLHYHTINENSYIKNLQKSLETANIQVKEDAYNRLEAKVKPKVKNADWFKNGKIYVNKVIPTTPEDYQSLDSYNVSSEYEVNYESSIEQLFGSNQETVSGNKRHEQELNIDQRLLQKAIQRNKFYRFNNLKQYVPSISSMKEFLESDNFLGNLCIRISLPTSLSVDQLSPQQRLKIVEKFLAYAEKNIRSNYMKLKGTPIFEGIAFSKLINDYVVEMNKITNMNEVVDTRNMRDHDWYIYDKAIVNNLESNFIDFINDYVEDLKEKYNDVYLIRNERKIKIVEIDGTRGFMPDFLLYMKDENTTYQVFLEPKGGHLYEQDKWKEEFLMSLSSRSDVEILSENEQVRLIGIKFYSSSPELKQKFKEDFIDKLF
ncbi:DEAD/DEAH box helicase [Lentibacillus cibarius]|uniref:DEAD/DEAH box helicase n=1 Tax=Lentibacillus cibarius TaxID=2583219 RepID=A0A549YHT9_9BACI|nr:DEAD/DEAH box helicase family protein [Lentibacillus cibarius]TRM11443.1 DEAD/DEAH box helicase [Lentibacillus cibarius]